MESPNWTLLPGDSIRRVDLHRDFGGSGQGGISPSRSSPNVFLFTDPVGLEHGYIADGWVDDRRYAYTGEGQRGDQVLKSGNKAILEHATRDRALRLFSGSHGSVVYVGEFKLNSNKPYEFRDAPSTANGPLRKILVFNLELVNETGHTGINGQSYIVKDVPIEAQFAETVFFKTSGESVEAHRAEGALVSRFRKFLLAQGHVVHRKMITPPGSSYPLFTDLHVEDINLLVEAKASMDRGAFRMAIGQLLDYRRFLNEPKCAILLPAKPADDLLKLAAVEGITVCWATDTGFTPLSA